MSHTYHAHDGSYAMSGPAEEHYDGDGGGDSPGYGPVHVSYSSSPSDDVPCCPLVVDPLCLLAILAGLGLATYILNIAISKKLGGRRKRRDAPNIARLALSVNLGRRQFFAKDSHICSNVHVQHCRRPELRLLVTMFNSFLKA
jgi:hypothetical protein